MKSRLAAIMCLEMLLLCGCHHEDPFAQKTDPPEKIKAEIQQVQNDPKIPPQAKGMILGHLKSDLQQSQPKPSGNL